jgi:uncharacterized protein
MSLQDRLMADMQDAMRAGDTVRRDTLRLLRAAIRNREIELQRDATDEDVVEVISRQVKQRSESIEMFRQGGRQDLVDAEEAQKAILEEYLPQQLTQAEITAAVQEIVAEMGAADMRQMGAVMREAMSRLKGRADGRLVNQVVREILSQ